MARPKAAAKAGEGASKAAPQKVIDVENFVRVRDSVRIITFPAFLSSHFMI